MSSRRKSREERKKEIWDAAKQVFLEKGYQSATMDEIIARTELSKGGVYHYYSDKRQIMLDIMRNFNDIYMQHNAYMLKLHEPLSREEKIEVLLEALLDKFLVVNSDKVLFTMFCYEMIYESAFWDIFIEMETEFFYWVSKRLEIEVSSNAEDLKLMSRMMNGFMFAQNVFQEPEVFINNKALFKNIFETMLRKFL